MRSEISYLREMIRIKLVMRRNSAEFDIKKKYWIVKILMIQANHEPIADENLFPYLLRNSVEIITHFLM